MRFPAIAAEPPARAPTSKAIASVNRMDPAKGSFHAVHAKKMKLACETCHEAEPRDVLVLSKASARSPGHVNREACLACHQEPGKPTWYGRAP